MRKNTTKSRLSINRCFKLVILTDYINIKKRKGIILLSFRYKFYASMLFIHAVYKKLEMFFSEKITKNIINIPSVYNSFKMTWTVVQPFIFVMA